MAGEKSTPVRTSARSRTSTRPRRFGDSPPPSASPPVTPGAKKHGQKRKRGVELDLEVEAEIEGDAAAIDAAQKEEKQEEEAEEEEDPVWTDFSAEYYEVVEQLPLELHRNFALLRELDDQTQRHTARLLELIRQYVSARLPPPPRPSQHHIPLDSGKDAAEGTEKVDIAGGKGRMGKSVEILRIPMPDVETLRNGLVPLSREQTDLGDEAVTKVEGPTGDDGMEVDPVVDASVAELAVNAEAGPSGTTNAVDLNLDGPKGHTSTPLAVAVRGDEAMTAAGPASAEMTTGTESPLGAGREPLDPSLKGDSGELMSRPSPASAGASITLDPSLSIPSDLDPSFAAFPPTTQAAMKRLDLVPATSRLLLPEIGRLAREMLRGADEKVGVATGVYNSVDRHIRSLDIALEAQQTALNLGIREDTLPSHAIEGSGSALVMGGGDEGGMTIGSGGGAAVAGGVRAEGSTKRKSKKGRGKKGKTAEVIQVDPFARGPVVVGQYDLKVDPYEPRYCYCGGYSFGVMIACDGEDCPNAGWIHLACQGLAKPPSGDFYCNDCRPNKKR